MVNPIWFKKNLPEILYPQGNATDPNNLRPMVIPDVLDSDGNPVYFTSNARLVSQVSGVDVGDSPNSNTGDPLRTAFVKIDNIVEAMYRNDLAKNYRLLQMEAPGRFLGMFDYEQIPLPPQRSVVDPTVTINAHDYPQDGDWVILRNRIAGNQTPASLSSFKYLYPFVNTGPTSAVYTSTFTSMVEVNAYSILRWDTALSRNSSAAIGDTTLAPYNLYPELGSWRVIQQRTLDDISFSIDQGLARLATGTAAWYNYDSENGPVGTQQQELYAQYQEQSAQNLDSKRLRSRNFEDAVTELVARSTINQTDAGYYG